jgi:hypothetical protein
VSYGRGVEAARIRERRIGLCFEHRFTLDCQPFSSAPVVETEMENSNGFQFEFEFLE